LAEHAGCGRLLTATSPENAAAKKGEAVDPMTIALAPDLGIKAEDFVEAWNASEKSRAIALANADRAPAEQFEPVSLTAVLVGIATGIAANVICELIKKALQNRKAGMHVEVREITNADGSRMIVVTSSAK
jgi:hypothetical protein